MGNDGTWEGPPGRCWRHSGHSMGQLWLVYVGIMVNSCGIMMGRCWVIHGQLMVYFWLMMLSMMVDKQTVGAEMVDHDEGIQTIPLLSMMRNSYSQ